MFNWLLILIGYLPFQIALNPGFGFDLASGRVFIVLLFLFWLIRSLIGKTFKNYLDSFQSIGLVLFLILAGISILGAENTIWGLRKVLFFLSIFPIYFLIISLTDHWLKIKKVLLIWAGSSLLVILIGLSQFFTQFIFSLERVYSFWSTSITPVFSGFNLSHLILSFSSWLIAVDGKNILRAFSVFSDPHMFAFYLGMTMPLILVLITVLKKWLFAFYILYGLAFFSLLVTFTRGAYLGIIITSFILSGLFWKYLDFKKAALLICLPLLIFIIPGTPFSDRFYSSLDLSDGSNIGRLEMWQEASQMSLDNLWQGVGLGNYSLVFDKSIDYRNPMTAHNLYLDIFSEMGIFALIIWLILIFGTILELFQKLRKEKDYNQEQKTILIGLIGALTYFSVHSIFESAVYSPVILSLLLVVLGLSVVTVKKKYL